MTREQILYRIKDCLQTKYGDRLRGVVLYGSEARGESGVHSDIDLLVLLEGPIDYGRDLETNLEAIYPLSLQIGRRISAKSVEIEEYETVECHLYQHAHSEGIMV